MSTSSLAQLVDPGDPSGGEDDANSFCPKPGDTYMFSAWVQEDNPDQQITYTNCSCELQLGFTSTVVMEPTGDIIDGWQRIAGEFTIPATAGTLNIKLVSSNSGINCFFDDVRVFPYNGSMKSYVYDPVTQRLMADLDENNYATFYEYDIEGGLVRIKRETEEGVKTVQETRSNNAKGF